MKQLTACIVPGDNGRYVFAAVTELRTVAGNSGIEAFCSGFHTAILSYQIWTGMDYALKTPAGETEVYCSLERRWSR